MSDAVAQAVRRGGASSALVDTLIKWMHRGSARVARSVVQACLTVGHGKSIKRDCKQGSEHDSGDDHFHSGLRLNIGQRKEGGVVPSLLWGQIWGAKFVGDRIFIRTGRVRRGEGLRKRG